MSTRDPDRFIDQFSAVRRRVTALAQLRYAAIDLGASQPKFLRAIGAGAPISQADLARATESDPALTGRAVQALIERDLVVREPSPTDGRAYVLALTAAGKKTLARALKIRTVLATDVVAALDDRDLADFDRIAAKLLAALG